MRPPAEPSTRARAGPYVGLDFFGEADADVFFGRDDERKMIIGNLRASRLTLLYAESGVGKSSLLRAGVAARLRRQAERHAGDEGTRRSVPVVFSRWRDDPVAGLADELEAAVAPYLEPGRALDLPRDRLDDAVAAAAKPLDAALLVMLDQFEEFFLYHGNDDAGARFADGLARCIARTDVRANFLISIREDVYSSIGDRFQASIPNVYGNYLHLDHLDRRDARSAITGPLERLNETLPQGAPRYDIERELVDDVLSQVRRGERGGEGERFETAYLQLVMERLWGEEERAGSRILHAETLRRLKGADTIIRTHVHDAMDALPADEQEAVAAAFRFLVTSGGRKIALTTRELAEFSGRADEEPRLEDALRRLEDARILRGVAAASSGNGSAPASGATRWELFHDILAEPVLAWRGEHDRREAQRRLAAAQDEARRAKRRSLVLLALTAFAVLGLVIAVISYFNAVDAGHQRDSQKLASASGAALATDPDESVRLALEGLDEAQTSEAENALRVALPASRLRSVLPVTGTDGGAATDGRGAPPSGTSVAFGAADTVAVGESGGGVRIWRWRDKREIARLQEPRRVDRVQLDAAGRRLLTVTATSAALWDLADCQSDRSCDAAERWNDKGMWTAAMSGDGCVVGVSGSDGAAGGVVTLHGQPHCIHSPACRTPVEQTLEATRKTAWIGFARGSCRLATAQARYGPDGSIDRRISIWDVRDGRYQRTADIHTDRDWGATPAIALSPDGDLIAAADDHGFRVWDIQECGRAACAPVSAAPAGHATGIAFAPVEHRVAVTSEDGVARIFDVDAPEPLIVLRGHSERILGVAFDATGDQIATASADGTTRVWDAVAENVVVRTAAPIAEAGFMAGDRILATSEDGSVRIHDARDRQRELGVILVSADSSVLTPAQRERWRSRPIFGNPLGGELTAAAASPDGRWILTGSSDGSLSRWPVRRCVQQYVCEWLDGIPFGPGGSLQPVERIAYGAGGRLVAVAMSLDGVRILSDGAVLRATLLTGEETETTTVAFSATGERLVTAGADGKARVWDVSGCLEQRCKPPLLRTLAQPCVLTTAEFSPDGKRIVTACGDQVGRVWAWQDEDAKPVLLEGHSGAVMAATFTAGGAWVITGGVDRTTRVWDAATGEVLGVLQLHTDRVRSVAVAAHDSPEILSSSDDGTARMYMCTACFSVDELRARAKERQDSIHRPPRPLPG
jgi:WD40 repeat protein